MTYRVDVDQREVVFALVALFQADPALTDREAVRRVARLYNVQQRRVWPGVPVARAIAECRFEPALIGVGPATP
jgi:hypothetical protein